MLKFLQAFPLTLGFFSMAYKTLLALPCQSLCPVHFWALFSSLPDFLCLSKFLLYAAKDPDSWIIKICICSICQFKDNFVYFFFSKNVLHSYHVLSNWATGWYLASFWCLQTRSLAMPFKLLSKPYLKPVTKVFPVSWVNRFSLCLN